MKGWEVVLEKHFPSATTWHTLKTFETREGAWEWAKIWCKLHHLDLPELEVTGGQTVTITIIE